MYPAHLQTGQVPSMLKPYLLRFHRWLTLAFALPLLVVLGTGLILSVEPSLTIAGMKSGTLTLEKVEAWLDEHDEANQARSLTHRSASGSFVIGMPDDDDDVVLDIATGQELSDDRMLDTVMRTSRRLHETLLLDLGWLVTASTFAMLAIATLGIFMGWPRLRNTVSGWHQGMAWFALPLVILSPLTGLAIAYGITFLPAAARNEPVLRIPMAEAVKLVAAQHDLSNLINLRPRGQRLIARINEGGEYRSYAVTAQGLTPQPRNWPRLIHEGNWGGHLSALINVITSFALIGMMGTGLLIWLRRKLRKRQPRVRANAVPAE
jgi:uncharacterized iron-regulated membrane protein